MYLNYNVHVSFYSFAGQNNLIGTIPREIASLNLTTLDFLSNKLQGSIPHELYTLTDISYLNLGYNDFTGTIASELGAMDKLSEYMGAWRFAEQCVFLFMYDVLHVFF